MNIVIAMDSFKGSLSSLCAGEAVAEGIKKAIPHSVPVVLPVADGGEGTVDALVNGLGGMLYETDATDPLGRKIKCTYGVLSDNTAVIEMCSAAGLTLLKDNERNPLNTTTYGVGQIILSAIKKGCRKFIIGIGGSATNDGGAGMLEALGFQFLDENNNPVSRGGDGIKDIKHIKTEGALPELRECSFRIACDVTNPLCGENGCSAVYGPQKGASADAVESMDKSLREYARIVKSVFPCSDADFPGAGAAGGMGFAFRSFLGGELVRGIDLIVSLTNMDEKIKNSHFVITGEGRIDRQTAMGKAPVGVASVAKKYGKPVVAFCGCLGEGFQECNNHGIDAVFSITKEPCDIKKAMESSYASKNLTDTAEQVFRVIKTGKIYES